MNTIKYKLRLDCSKSGSQASIYTKKGDVQSRELSMYLYNGSEPYEIEEGASVVLRAVKPDGTLVYTDCTVSGNIIKKVMPAQMMVTAGTVACELDVYGAGSEEVLFSPEFNVYVSEPLTSDDDIVSSDDFSALTSAMTSIQSTETAIEAAEELRVTAETGRETAETARSTAEGLRVSAESSRVSAETSRVSAESARVTAENLRVSRESGRDQEESTRDRQESERLEAETAREALAAKWSNPSATATQGENVGVELTLGDNGVEFGFVLKKGDPGDVSSVDGVEPDAQGNVALGVAGSDASGVSGALTLAGVSGTEAASKVQIVGESTLSGTPAYNAPITVTPKSVAKVSVGSNTYSLATATELHGMAVLSDGNITYNGQQFIADVYDAATDRLVKYWDELTYVGTENWTKENTGATLCVKVALSNTPNVNAGLSTHFPFSSSIAAGTFRTTTTWLKIYVSGVINTSDETQVIALWKSFLAAQNTAGTPVKFYIPRATAVETYNACGFKAGNGIISVKNASNVEQAAKLLVRYNDIWESMRVLRERADRYNTTLTSAVAELAAT